jgi:hypothetical protein
VEWITASAQGSGRQAHSSMCKSCTVQPMCYCHCGVCLRGASPPLEDSLKPRYLAGLFLRWAEPRTLREWHYSRSGSRFVSGVVLPRGNVRRDLPLRVSPALWNRYCVCGFAVASASPYARCTSPGGAFVWRALPPSAGSLRMPVGCPAVTQRSPLVSFPIGSRAVPIIREGISGLCPPWRLTANGRARCREAGCGERRAG